MFDFPAKKRLLTFYLHTRALLLLNSTRKGLKIRHSELS